MSTQLVRAALSGTIDEQIAGVLHALTISIGDEDVSLAGEGIRVLQMLVEAHDQQRLDSAEDIVKKIRYAVDTEAVSGEAELDFGLGVMSDGAVPLEWRAVVEPIVEAVITEHDEEIVGAGDAAVLGRIFLAYMSLSLDAVNADRLDLAPYAVFRTLFSYPEALASFWDAVPGFVGQPGGGFAALSALVWATEDPAFIEEHAGGLVELAISCLQDPKPLVREAAAEALQLWLEVGEFDATAAAGAIVAAHHACPAKPFLDCLAAIGSRTSLNFHDYFRVITSDMSDLEAVCHALSVLLENDEGAQKVSVDATAEFALQAGIGSSAGLELAATLARVARGKFAGWLPRFLESALAVIEEGSSPAGAHAIGHFLESNALALTRHAERILAVLSAAASRDLQSSVEDEYGGEEQGLDKRVSASAAALRVLGLAVVEFKAPFESVLPIFEARVREGDGELICGSAVALHNLVEAGVLDATVLPLLHEIAKSDTAGVEGTGLAFSTTAELIAAGGSDFVEANAAMLAPLIDDVRDVFGGDRLYLGKNVKIDPELHEPALRVLREIAASVGDAAIPILEPFVEPFWELLQSETWRDIALNFFGDVLQWCPGFDRRRAEEFAPIAVSALATGTAAAFGTVKQVAMVTPSILTPELVSTALDAIEEVLSIEDRQKVRVMEVQDNACAALYRLALLLDEQFPVARFATLALGCCPAQTEVEEGSGLVRFVLWLHTRCRGEPRIAFVGALGRLMADGHQLEYVDEALTDEARTLLAGILSPDAPFDDLMQALHDREAAELVFGALS